MRGCLVESNLELIKRCREALTNEDAPYLDEWQEMVGTLCDALEKRERDWEAMTKAHFE